jgi:hypothetical protein
MVLLVGAQGTGLAVRGHLLHFEWFRVRLRRSNGGRPPRRAYGRVDRRLRDLRVRGARRARRVGQDVRAAAACAAPGRSDGNRRGDGRGPRRGLSSRARGRPRSRRYPRRSCDRRSRGRGRCAHGSSASAEQRGSTQSGDGGHPTHFRNQPSAATTATPTRRSQPHLSQPHLSHVFRGLRRSRCPPLVSRPVNRIEGVRHFRRSTNFADTAVPTRSTLRLGGRDAARRLAHRPGTADRRCEGGRR